MHLKKKSIGAVMNGICPPKFICWYPNHQCDGISRWDLWEVVRSWGWNLHEWDSCFCRMRQESLLPLSVISYVRIQEGSNLSTRKQAFTTHWICWHLDLGLPASTIVRNKRVLFKQKKKKKRWLWHFSGVRYSSRAQGHVGLQVRRVFTKLVGHGLGFKHMPSSASEIRTQPPSFGSWSAHFGQTGLVVKSMTLDKSILKYWFPYLLGIWSSEN